LREHIKKSPLGHATHGVHNLQATIERTLQKAQAR
jgi:hypothetical protein